MTDDHYKREEDRRWREEVNKQLAIIMSSDVVQNSRLDALHERQEELKDLLEGVPGDKADGGLKADIRELAASLNMIKNALCLDVSGKPGYDHTGKPGPLLMIEDIAKGTAQEERKAQRRIPIILSVISLIGLLLTNIDKFTPLWKKTPPPVEVKAKPRKQKRRVVVRQTEIDDGMREMPGDHDGALE